MREAVVSLIYKEKGERNLLANYRPISVTNTLYKILAKAMVISLHDITPHLISVEQTGFQVDKYITENARLVQDTIAYCESQNKPGVLVFCDQSKAYDRIDWSFMKKVMTAMKIPAEFIQLGSS